MQLSMITPTTPLTGRVRDKVGLSTLLGINFCPRGGALGHAYKMSSRRCLALEHAYTGMSALDLLKIGGGGLDDDLSIRIAEPQKELARVNC